MRAQRRLLELQVAAEEEEEEEGTNTESNANSGTSPSTTSTSATSGEGGGGDGDGGRRATGGNSLYFPKDRDKEMARVVVARIGKAKDLQVGR